MRRTSTPRSSKKKDAIFKQLFSILMLIGLSIYAGYMVYLEQPTGIMPPLTLATNAVKLFRHLIPLIVGWRLAHNTALTLVQILYNLPDRQTAETFLFRRRKPHNRSKPIVVKSKMLEDQRSKHVSLRVGGPDWIRISKGEVAITERDGYVHRVLEAGDYYLDMLEYIYIVLDSKPQERKIDALLYTREYIPVTAVITIRFRINSGQVKMSDDDDNPYPVDKNAVKNIVYARSVKKDGSITDWDAKVKSSALHTLRRIVHTYSLSEIMFNKNVYADIHTELTPLVQTELKASGFNLISIRVANIKPKDETVFEQSIKLWKTNQEASIHRQKAENHAQYLFNAEVGKAEAELDMIRAIIEGVDQARSEGAVIDIKSTISLRLIQAMEGLLTQASETQPIAPQLMASLRELNQIQLDEQMQLSLNRQNKND